MEKNFHHVLFASVRVIQFRKNCFTWLLSSCEPPSGNDFVHVSGHSSFLSDETAGFQFLRFSKFHLIFLALQSKWILRYYWSQWRQASQNVGSRVLQSAQHLCVGSSSMKALTQNIVVLQRTQSVISCPACLSGYGLSLWPDSFVGVNSSAL